VASTQSGRTWRESFDQFPGAVLGGEGDFRNRPRGVRLSQPWFPSLDVRDDCRAQLDLLCLSIIGVEKLKNHKLSAAMAILTRAWTLPVSRSIPANRLSVPDVCTRDPRSNVADARLGRQSAAVFDSLDSRLSSGDDCPGLPRIFDLAGFLQDPRFTIHTQNLAIFCSNSRHGSPDSSRTLWRLDFLFAEDLATVPWTKSGPDIVPRPRPASGALRVQHPSSTFMRMP